ncbi:OLC1v1012037C1 [Oldenlandia corymbosa var. corymbosa]|uniref:OLC1v1012037C1 n=1 Tax=Oldenlandia corymbosa var. corymbosa TaxID=529605 RepID=A0AAV1DYF0_OLDCO|nr:OLC1v1012037C1 [Oldenlandia corymbosa var. corymbosa]
MFVFSLILLQRKRKLQQLLKDLPSPGSWLSNQQSGSKLSRGASHSSSTSCLLNSGESVESFGRKIIWDSHSSNNHMILEDNIESRSVDEAINLKSSCKDVITLLDSDESVNCLNNNSPEDVTSLEEVPSLSVHGSSIPVHSSRSLAKDSPIKKQFSPHRQSIRSLNLIDDDPQRMVIPVGPRFQADVPEWTGPQNDSGNSKWLGTQIWPIKGGGKGSATRVIGEGRSESCSCSSPASIECVQRHIIEKRLVLLCDLGSAFFRMKLDETGEQIARSWTPNEQDKYNLLASNNRVSDGKDFLKHALKCFPNKCQKAIMSYYFNVYILRRMSQQTRLSKQVDTDDEEEVNFSCSDSRRKSEGKKASCISKDVKARFLRRP